MSVMFYVLEQIYVIYRAGGPYGKKTVLEVLSTARGRRGSDLPFFHKSAWLQLRMSSILFAEYWLQQITFRLYYAWADDYL